MSTITFDTLKFANKLKAAGVPSAQAEAEADVLVEAWSEQRAEVQALIDAQRKAIEDAAKRDFSDAQLRSENVLIRLEAKFDKGFAAVDKQLAEIRGEISKASAEHRGEINKAAAEHRGEMSKAAAEHKGDMLMIKWMLGLLVVTAAGVLVKPVAMLIAKTFF